MTFARKFPVPIPDRMSAHPQSKYHHADHPAVRISVDGREYTGRVVEFCRSKGWARVIETNAKGEPVLACDGKTTMVKWKHGLITVWLATEPAPSGAITPMVMQ